MKQGDFVAVSYTGKTSEGVFDTTDEKIAQEHGLQAPKQGFGPVTLRIGDGYMLPKLEEAMQDKELGKAFSVELQPEDAFGKKDAKRIQLIGAGKFKAAKMDPYPGMPVSIDNMQGIVRKVGGGRILVDFNHPLSGQVVTYDLTVEQQVTDSKEQLECVLRNVLPGAGITVEGEKATLALAFDMPEELQGEMSKQFIDKVPGIKEIVYTVDEKAKAALEKSIAAQSN